MNQMKVPARFLNRVIVFDEIPLLLEGKVKRSETGLPQGAASSPLLANLVLNELGLLDRLPGGSRIFQYVDDCVIIGPADCVAEDVLVYESRLRDGVSISEEKSGWNSSGILKFIGFTLDINSGVFSATPRNGDIKIIDNIYSCDINSPVFIDKLRRAFVLDSLISLSSIQQREPKFRGVTCEQVLERLKLNTSNFRT
jgi:hypothetical protein